MRCTGVILAGGSASRLGGRAKGLEAVGGRRIADRVADVLQRCTDSLLLIANTPEASEWLPGVRCASDIVPGFGALSGVHAALHHASTPVLVVAWDMPFVRSELLSDLRSLGELSPNADAAAPESVERDDGSVQCEPLCTWYSPRALSVIEHQLTKGDRRMMALLASLQTARLTLSDVRRFGDPQTLFMNVNTEEQLNEAREVAARHSDVRSIT